MPGASLDDVVHVKVCFKHDSHEPSGQAFVDKIMEVSAGYYSAVTLSRYSPPSASTCFIPASIWKSTLWRSSIRRGETLQRFNPRRALSTERFSPTA